MGIPKKTRLSYLTLLCMGRGGGGWGGVNLPPPPFGFSQIFFFSGKGNDFKFSDF